jgi:hypothetical protein
MHNTSGFHIGGTQINDKNQATIHIIKNFAAEDYTDVSVKT